MVGLYRCDLINNRCVDFPQVLLAFLFLELFLSAKIKPFFHFLHLVLQCRACGPSDYFFNGFLQYSEVLNSSEEALNSLIDDKMRGKLSMSRDEESVGVVEFF